LEPGEIRGRFGEQILQVGPRGGGGEQRGALGVERDLMGVLEQVGEFE
jgi:hypothetical protein